MTTLKREIDFERVCVILRRVMRYIHVHHEDVYEILRERERERF